MNNNNQQFEKFIRDMKNINMSENQKNEMRENLKSFAYNYEYPEIRSPHSFIQMFKRPLALALIVFLAIGISKPAAASALPGELLYTVKIIHEEIEAATKTSPEKKVAFKIEQTETRIQEAIQLADEEKFDIKTQNKLAKNIKTYTEIIAVEINDIKEDNPQKALELTADLKTTISSNSKALQEVKKSKKKQAKKNTEEQFNLSTSNNTISDINEMKETFLDAGQDSDTADTLPLETKEDVEALSVVETDVPSEETVIIVDPILESNIPTAGNEDLFDAVTIENYVTEEQAGIASDNESILIDVNENLYPQDTDMVSNITEISNIEGENLGDENDVDIFLDSLVVGLELTEDIEDEVKKELIKNLDEATTTIEVVKTQESKDVQTMISPDATELLETITIADEIFIELETLPIDAILAEQVQELSLEDIQNLESDADIIIEKTTPNEEPLDGSISDILSKLEYTGLETTAAVAPVLASDERIQNEISALEQVRALKQRLYDITLEADVVMSLEQKLIVDTQLQEHIDKGQYGQAIIYIQSEIDIMSEKIQSTQIQEDFGISIQNELDLGEIPLEDDIEILVIEAF